MRLKPVIAEKAKEQQVRKPADFVPQKSAEQTPIETRQELAKIAGVSHDTIAKVERIEEEPEETATPAPRFGAAVTH